jgi:CRISPR-associated endonuclease/helicase Cas3
MAQKMTESARLLAKDTGETLAQHTIHCLEIAESVLANLPFEETNLSSISDDLREAIAVHDVGKAAMGFQKSLGKNSKRWGRRHEVISASFASSQKLKEEIIFAVLTHHKTIPSDGILSCKSCLHFEEIPFASDVCPVWFKMAKEWEENRQLFAIEWTKILNRVKSKNLNARIGKLPYLTLPEEWLDSWQQAKNVDFARRLYASLLRGLLMSCDHVASSNAQINVPEVPILANIMIDVPTLHNFQKKASLIEGNLILQAPTGSGKTLAALLWAGKNQKRNGRLFYCLPNIASINAMYLRLSNKYYGRENVGLLHSRAMSSLYSLWENDDDLPMMRQKNALLAKSLAKEIWYPIRVCTPHQILRYTLHGKGWEMMLSEFPNSCFVFDEIHAYDPVVTGFIMATARFLTENKASCLFLSATMPDFIKKMLENEISPIEFVAPSFDDQSDRNIVEKKRHYLRIADGSILTNLDSVVETIKSTGSTLIVCNHVPSAQLVFQEISKKGVKDTVLLHSRFCRRDRDNIEKLLQERMPEVLVATQVVEVSLDVDFEQAFSEPAPIDAVIQRLGRVNRKGERSPAKVVVFKEQISKYPIYSEDIVSRSIAELQCLSNPLREMDLIDAANRVYRNGYDCEDLERYNNALNHPLIKCYRQRLVAGFHYDWTEQVIDQTDGTVDLLPRCLAARYADFQSQGLWLESNRLLVPVRTASLSYLSECLNTNHDPWIINKPYSSLLGLSLKSQGEIE